MFYVRVKDKVLKADVNTLFQIMIQNTHLIKRRRHSQMKIVILNRLTVNRLRNVQPILKPR